jgi:cell wall assembly regulator SMI1
MSYKKLHEKIILFSDKECGIGVTTKEINQAEMSIGVPFSKSYRQFLQEFGWARFAHQELYGLGSDVPSYLELVRNTNAERNQMRPSLLRYLVPLMNDGSGNHYCLDTRMMRNSECPVVLWNHELGEDQHLEFVSDTFDTWLSDMLTRLQSE